jgi:isoleucyl-tRNA synthetase
MSTVLENTEPFRAVFSYAMMRDEQGDEMHKSKGNAIWFEDAAERMGVDSMRWVYIRQRPEANLNFGVGIADGVRRSFLIPLWNVYSFFVTYANIDGYEPGTEAPAVKDRPELDRWIISELNELIAEVTADLERYDPKDACARFESFVGYLSNWYVRRSRRRFWKSETDDDKLAAYSTLYECLVTLSRLLAPFVPFLTETIYQNLARSVASQYESVHLESYPVADGTKIDRGLSEATRLAMRLSSLGRAARSKAGLKVRQPLERAVVGLRSASDRVAFEQIKDQVRDELNVKDVAEMEDDGEVVGFHVEADLSKVGPRFGAQTREVVAVLQSLDAREVYRRVSAGRQVEAGDFTLEPDEVLVTRTDAGGFASATEAEYTVAVMTAVSHELELEGLARELVHVVQSMRRSAGFDIADRIEMYLTGDADLDELVATHGDYIRQETLSRAITKEAAPEHAFSESHRLNGREAQIGLVRQ